MIRKIISFIIYLFKRDNKDEHEDMFNRDVPISDRKL